MPLKDPEARRTYNAARYQQRRGIQRAYAAAYRSANLEQRRDYQAAYYAERREELKAKVKRYRTNNRDKVRVSKAAYANTPAGKIGGNLRRRLLMAIKRGSRVGSAIRDLGCSVPAFKAWIEGQFHPWMTWENWGVTTWHLDHIIPLSSFDLSDPEQFKRAMHYSNYQPLPAAENNRKHARLDYPRPNLPCVVLLGDLV